MKQLSREFRVYEFTQGAGGQDHCLCLEHYKGQVFKEREEAENWLIDQPASNVKYTIVEVLEIPK